MDSFGVFQLHFSESALVECLRKKVKKPSVRNINSPYWVLHISCNVSLEN